jgi:hypothetical protein
VRSKALLTLVYAFSLAAGTASVARADGSPSATDALATRDIPFHSRTCGLVLLSDGRAQTRAVKAAGTGAFVPAMSQLTKAFLLLRDGRGLQAPLNEPREYFAQRLSTGRSTQPANQALPQAIAHCEQWFEDRRGQPDFDRSEAASWDAAAQAKLTLESE